jgi:hypothetical protein
MRAVPMRVRGGWSVYVAAAAAEARGDGGASSLEEEGLMEGL